MRHSAQLHTVLISTSFHRQGQSPSSSCHHSTRSAMHSLLSSRPPPVLCLLSVRPYSASQGTEVLSTSLCNSVKPVQGASSACLTRSPCLPPVSLESSLLSLRLIRCCLCGASRQFSPRSLFPGLRQSLLILLSPLHTCQTASGKYLMNCSSSAGSNFWS